MYKSAHTRPANAATEAVSGRAATRGIPTPLGTWSPLSSFVGRELQLRDVHRVLIDTRLLTLTGPGGVGKTRLALELARELERDPRFADGVRFSGLAALTDAALVPQEIAAVLGVREEAGQHVVETMQEALRDRRLLLVLDNCEHLVAPCAALAEALLRVCPGLTILATSREPLNIAGETVWPVPPLSVPTPTEARLPDALLRHEAVRLFVERARAAAPTFALSDANASATAEICMRLDGIPLAIELAAARIRMLGPQQIADRLNDRFRLLTGGARTALPRHQTIRALVDWSYELLPEQERTLFCRLGVFAGGWSLDMAEAVGAGEGIDQSSVMDLLGRLVDKSLVVVQPHTERAGEQVRYDLLETLRHYALERLTADNSLESTARRHASYFLDLVERADARFWASDEAGALSSIEPEHDNVRAALRYFLSTGAVDYALRLASSMGMFWFIRGYCTEGRTWLHEALGLAAADGPAASSGAAHAKALHADGRLAHVQGDYGVAEERLHAAITIWQRLGDDSQMANALFLLGRIALARGDRAAMMPLLLESLARAERVGYQSMQRLTRLWLAQVAFEDGDDEATRAWAAQVLGKDDAGGSRRDACFALRLLGDVEARQGNRARARELLEASLAHGREVGRWLAAWSALDLADLLIEQDPEAARRLLQEALTAYRDAGDREGVAATLEVSARFAAAVGLAAAALRLGGATAALRATVGALSGPGRSHLHAYFDGARATLGAGPADVAWTQGMSLSYGRAISEALALLDSPAPARPDVGNPAQASVEASPLTSREREVAALVARGQSNRAIASQLVISEGTAERHVGNIFAKLGLGSRAQLAVWAVEHGLLQENL